MTKNINLALACVLAVSVLCSVGCKVAKDNTATAADAPAAVNASVAAASETPVVVEVSADKYVAERAETKKALDAALSAKVDAEKKAAAAIEAKNVLAAQATEAIERADQATLEARDAATTNYEGKVKAESSLFRYRLVILAEILGALILAWVTWQKLVAWCARTWRNAKAAAAAKVANAIAGHQAPQLVQTPVEQPLPAAPAPVLATAVDTDEFAEADDNDVTVSPLTAQRKLRGVASGAEAAQRCADRKVRGKTQSFTDVRTACAGNNSLLITGTGAGAAEG